MIFFAIAAFVVAVVVLIAYQDFQSRRQDKESLDTLYAYHRYMKFSGVLFKLELIKIPTMFTFASQAAWKYLK